MSDTEEDTTLPVPLDDADDVDIHDALYGPPVDQGWAWMTVLACFGVCAMVVGSMKSFGVLLVDLTRRLDAPTSVIVSTHSLAGFFHLGLAPVSNALSDRFSHRTLVFIGGIFTSVGLIATGFVTSVGWLFVTYGIIAGIGFGLTLGPSLVCMGLHFNKRRAFANGLSAAGSGAGSFALPNIIRLLSFEYGFSGCLLILGAIVLNTSACAVLLRPRSFWKRKQKQTAVETDDNEMIRYAKLKLDTLENNDALHSSTGNINKHSKIDNCINSADDVKFSSHPNINLQFSASEKSHISPVSKLIHIRHINTNEKLTERDINFSNHSLCYTSVESLSAAAVFPFRATNDAEGHSSESKRLCQSNLDWALLKNPVFLVLNTSLWLGIFGHHTIFNCLPSLCEEFGMSDTEGALVVSIVGLADMVGRISSGWFADFKILQRKTVFQLNMFLFALCMFATPHVTSFTGMAVVSALTGITTGGYIGIQISVLADAFGVQKLSSSLGFVFFFASISLLVSPFLSGLTRDMSGSWSNAVRLGASAGALGSLLIFLLPSAERMSSAFQSKNLEFE